MRMHSTTGISVIVTSLSLDLDNANYCDKIKLQTADFAGDMIAGSEARVGSSIGDRTGSSPEISCAATPQIL
jgi:hypothetical protein